MTRCGTTLSRGCWTRAVKQKLVEGLQRETSLIHRPLVHRRRDFAGADPLHQLGEEVRRHDRERREPSRLLCGPQHRE